MACRGIPWQGHASLLGYASATYGSRPSVTPSALCFAARDSGDDGKGPSETEKAEAWLVEYLRQEPRSSTQIETAAKDEGISRSALYRVKKSLGVVSERGRGSSNWVLPDTETLIA